MQPKPYEIHVSLKLPCGELKKEKFPRIRYLFHKSKPRRGGDNKEKKFHKDVAPKALRQGTKGKKLA